MGYRKSIGAVMREAAASRASVPSDLVNVILRDKNSVLTSCIIEVAVFFLTRVVVYSSAF